MGFTKKQEAFPLRECDLFFFCSGLYFAPDKPAGEGMDEKR